MRPGYARELSKSYYTRRLVVFETFIVRLQTTRVRYATGAAMCERCKTGTWGGRFFEPKESR